MHGAFNPSKYVSFCEPIRASKTSKSSSSQSESTILLCQPITSFVLPVEVMTSHKRLFWPIRKLHSFVSANQKLCFTCGGDDITLAIALANQKAPFFCISQLQALFYLLRWWHNISDCSVQSESSKLHSFVPANHKLSFTCGGDDITVSVAPAAQLEAARQREIARDLDRTTLCPHIHQITLSPAVWTTNKSEIKRLKRSVHWLRNQTSVRWW